MLRPPIGFIVEGHNEYASYPSIVSKIISTSGFQIPIVNAGGCGGVIRNLPYHLTDLVITYHPYEILVTVDLIDVIEQDLFDNCEDLIIGLDEIASTWLTSAQPDERFHPRPESVGFVIQVPQFESWIIADFETLVESGIIDPIEENFGDVDSEIRHPSKWLSDRLIPKHRFKNPRVTNSILRGNDIDRMRSNSRSFAKFHKEVMASYYRWLDASIVNN